tara:strand:- start:59 stop:1198 length:1140 start_codon:yes stop_codon:yes gene_type:complete
MDYAKAAFRRRPGPEQALFLHEALQIENQRAPIRAKNHRLEDRALLEQALALLPRETRTLIRAQESLRQALERGQAAEIRQALSDLREVPAPDPIADRLRVPLSIALALEHPATSQGDEGALANADRELRAYLARGRAPTGLLAWFAEVDRNRGRLVEAQAAIKEALERLSLAPAPARSRFVLQAALNAVALGEDDQALTLVREVLGTSEDPLMIAAAKLTESQIRVRRGELEAARDALEVALAFCPEDFQEFLIQLALAKSRIQLEDRQLVAARESLREAKTYKVYTHAPADVRCSAKALEAAILNGEGEHQRALESSEAALKLWKGEPLANCARLSALVGLGRVEEAKERARDLLEGSDLNPGPRAEIAAWLERAGE